jgi:hypothetical protein
MAKLERQRRGVRLRSWVDPVTGMWHINGQFDPVTGLQLNGRLDAAIAALFADKTPQTCPSVPGEKQDHLCGLALLNLVGIDPDAAEEKAYSPRPAGPRFGRPEFVIVVDTVNRSATGEPTVDCGLPVEIPWRVLVDLFGAADVHTVVVRNGVVLCAPGRLDLGRTTRIASRAQRRALRGVYASCAVPGCSVRFDHTKLHHVRFWEHGGATDLDNLLPLCERHHHCVHDLGWQLHLGPQRELTITLPDGTIMTTGPPHRNAA